jgi:hypothetical protein
MQLTFYKAYANVYSMTSHESANDNGENRYAPQALALAAELRTKDGIRNPKPNNYRTAGKLLSLYFSDVPHQAGDVRFQYALDNTLSAADALFIRDEYTHRKAMTQKVGDHPADVPLMRALQSVHGIQEGAEAQGAELAYSAAGTQALIDELNEYHLSRVAPPDTDSRGIRFRAASTLERAAFVVRNVEGATPQLAQVGNYAAQMIYSMADTIALHPNDTGDVGVWNKEMQRLDIVQGDIPLYKDAIAREVSIALQTAYEQA